MKALVERNSPKIIDSAIYLLVSPKTYHQKILVIQAGTWRDFGATLFTAKKRYPLRLITFYDHGQKEHNSPE